LFGLAAIWKRRSLDRLDRLALAIEAIAGRDQVVMDESSQVDRIRAEGAAGLYGVCRKFVDELNGRLKDPALVLDPPQWDQDSFDDSRPNLLQISLRGRLLQIEFSATDEPYSTEEYRHRYVLEGSVHSFNQNFLERDTVDEQMIFFCAHEPTAVWHFFDPRTYRSGLVSVEYLASELERLL
jgi:hypothetical protein